jgi:hypothetical protein
MNKHVLLIGADPTNATDGVIVQGILNLLSIKLGQYTYEYLFLDDHNPMSDEQLNKNVVYDRIFVCGTPWLWDNFQNSVKYRNLLRCFELHSCHKYFMGIGTCLNNKDANSNILERPQEIEGIRKLYSGTTIYVRDEIAYQKLLKAGIPSKHLPCPSFFCYKDNEKTFEENVLIWCDPIHTISKSDWYNKDKLNKYYQLNLEFYKECNPVVYCKDEVEKANAIKIGLPEPIILQGYQHTLDVMQKAKYVLSGRVHCAVPAFVKGKGLGLLSIDTRSKTISDFGGLIINNVEDFKKLTIEERNFNNYITEYDII